MGNLGSRSTEPTSSRKNAPPECTEWCSVVRERAWPKRYPTCRVLGGQTQFFGLKSTALATAATLAACSAIASENSFGHAERQNPTTVPNGCRDNPAGPNHPPEFADRTS